jgi:hypothetical protein
MIAVVTGRRIRLDDGAIFAIGNGALRPSRFGGLHRPPIDDLHNRRCKPAFDDMEYTPIGDAAAQTSHQRRVRN